MPTAEEADFGGPAEKAADRSVRCTRAFPARFFEETAAVTPADRAEVVRHIVSVADQHKLTTAGIYSMSDAREGIFSSRGLSRWHRQTLAEISITMLGARFFRLAKAEFSGCEQSRRSVTGGDGRAKGCRFGTPA